MHISQNRYFRRVIVIVAVVISGASMYLTTSFTNGLKKQERHRVELWSKAMRTLINTDSDEASIDLAFEVVENNNTVPIILTDRNDSILSTRNIDLSGKNKDSFLKKQLAEMKEENNFFVIDLGTGAKQYMYYTQSNIIKRLTIFSQAQLFALLILLISVYISINWTRRTEQNLLWVGMAKETAHQLGTPISSLLGWIEILELKNADPATLNEVRKDVTRLKNIADRFSKIGSKPILVETDINSLLADNIDYFKARFSSNITFKSELDENIKKVKVSEILLRWVFENLTKNSIDAMQGNGSIEFTTSSQGDRVVIDISDSGKGIAKNRINSIFQPGYTTKKRGWGLGLSLTKRIVEEYHSGKIFVKNSELGKGTVFRIILK